MNDVQLTQAQKARLTNLKSMVVLALADGIIDDAEISSIAAVAARDNISIEEVEKMFMNKDEVVFTVPDDYILKTAYLRDLVVMMVIDGEINERELSICRIVAEKSGFSPDIVDAIAEDVMKSINTIQRIADK